ncbi:MAG: rhodanese-related sulfurtransferase [Proteobacteria bacterium]|nr:rhodanese-related sulfurtransferase [Pseudomonadota bacterium]
MFHIAAFYLFVRVEDPRSVADALRSVCRKQNIKGTILLASEGINGTIAGSEKAVEAVLGHLRDDPRFADLDAKHATSTSDPFYRLKVRLKSEIVTLGMGAVDAAGGTAPHVPAGEWNTLISDPDTVIIDTRNDYEVAIGTFEGAINPETRSFRDLPAWIEEHPEFKGKRLAMFCTGGIRCEKATAYLREQGYDEVYQLDGGILKYLETTDEKASLWNGECYVFDRRVSVGHGLVPGDLEVCPGCNHVIGDPQRQRDGYRKGICCHGCVDDLTPEREARFEERQRQIELAELRGETHLGRVFEDPL